MIKGANCLIIKVPETESLPHVKKYPKWVNRRPHEKRPKKAVDDGRATSVGEGVCSRVSKSSKEAEGIHIGSAGGSHWV
jgi:hypothetical protein